MYNDVIIGKFIYFYGLSDTGYPGLRKSEQGFWLDAESNYLGVSGTISIDTTQGQSINAYIEDGLDCEIVKNAITLFILREISVQKLVFASTECI